MSERIEIGDLVVVVRGNKCGCAAEGVGKIFTVDALFESVSICKNCRCIFPPEILASTNGRHYEASRLKKIPPLTEPEAVGRNEELTA